MDRISILRRSRGDRGRRRPRAPGLVGVGVAQEAQERVEARLLARVLDVNPDIRRNELLETVRRDLIEKLDYAQEEVTVSGLLVLYNNMSQSLFSSQIKTIGVVIRKQGAK